MVERSLMMERPLLYRDSTGGGEVPLVLDREVLERGPDREGSSSGVERVVPGSSPGVERGPTGVLVREEVSSAWAHNLYIGGAKYHYSRQRDHKMWVILCRTRSLLYRNIGVLNATLSTHCISLGKVRPN